MPSRDIPGPPHCRSRLPARWGVGAAAVVGYRGVVLEDATDADVVAAAVPVEMQDAVCACVSDERNVLRPGPQHVAAPPDAVAPGCVSVRAQGPVLARECLAVHVTADVHCVGGHPGVHQHRSVLHAAQPERFAAS